MKGTTEAKVNLEISEAYAEKTPINIKPLGEISSQHADDIYNRVLSCKYESVEIVVPEKGFSAEGSIRMESPKEMSLKSANELYDSMFENNDEQEGVIIGENGLGEPESNEVVTRELTEEEKHELKDKLGWSDEKIKKCTIDENGVIHFKTDRCDLEGKTAENGVPYERRLIEINGVKIEGVFPVFDSVFDTELDPENYMTNAYAKECNAKLKEAVEKDPDLRSKFTEEQLKDIEEGRTPTGYVWHHNEEPGKMQLVKREDHDRAIGGAAHTGGNSLWGPDSVEKDKKGEEF